MTEVLTGFGGFSGLFGTGVKQVVCEPTVISLGLNNKKFTMVDCCRLSYASTK